MFEAFKFVHKKMPKVKFIIIGFNNIEKYRKLARQLGLENNVIFTGKIKFEDTPRYLSLSSIAIAPKISMSEGDGKIYNYMAMQMGIVCFDRGISREILGDAGLFAEMKNVEEMSDKILELITNEELRNMLGRKARVRAEEKLSTDENAKKINEFYNTLIWERDE